MRQCRALVIQKEINNLENINEAFIVSLSKTDSDNLKLLKQYLPKDLNKSEFTDQEKEVIQKYNNYIDMIISRSKSSIIQIDFGLKKILI